jgi:hypothetical protein
MIALCKKSDKVSTYQTMPNSRLFFPALIDIGALNLSAPVLPNYRESLST